MKTYDTGYRIREGSIILAARIAAREEFEAKVRELDRLLAERMLERASVRRELRAA